MKDYKPHKNIQLFRESIKIYKFLIFIYISGDSFDDFEDPVSIKLVLKSLFEFLHLADL
jgi:hypothetical protein